MNTKAFRKIFIIGMFLPFIMAAQQKIVVNEVIKEMSKGTKNGYEVTVPEAMLREIKSDFSHYIRKDSKSRAEEKDGELFIIGAVNKSISPNPFNIYTKLQDADDGVKITAFFTSDDSLFISTADNEDMSTAVKKYLKEFATAEYKDFVKKELDADKRKQKDLEGELEDLIHSKQKSERNINEAKRTIESNNREIELLAKQISAKDDEIIKQKGMVSTLKGTGSDEEKLSQKNLKNLESDKRGMDKDKESKRHKIIPLGFEFPEMELRQKPAPNGILKLIFLGRINRKKGIDLLIKGLARLDKNLIENIRLDIYGNDDDNCKKDLESIIANNFLNASISFCGNLKPELRDEILKQYHCLVLTSHQENFGLVVTEALSIALPVYISDKVNLCDFVIENNCGWVSTLDEEDIAETILEIYHTSAGERHAKGMNGYDAVRKNFSMNEVAKQYVNLYKSIVNDLEPA